MREDFNMYFQRRIEFGKWEKLFFLWQHWCTWSVNSLLSDFGTAFTRVGSAIIFAFLSRLSICVSKTANVTEKNRFISNLLFRNHESETPSEEWEELPSCYVVSEFGSAVGALKNLNGVDAWLQPLMCWTLKFQTAPWALNHNKSLPIFQKYHTIPKILIVVTVATQQQIVTKHNTGF